LYAQRKTFLINPTGTIDYVFESVDVDSHADDVAAKLKELQAE
jgi:peroxiredoxin